jgi:hypothetical protein
MVDMEISKTFFNVEEYEALRRFFMRIEAAEERDVVLVHQPV